MCSIIVGSVRFYSISIGRSFWNIYSLTVIRYFSSLNTFKVIIIFSLMLLLDAAIVGLCLFYSLHHGLTSINIKLCA